MNQNRAMCCRIRKLHKLKVGCYAAHFIELNGFLASSPKGKLTDYISMTYLNEILLNSVPKTWGNQDYLQLFDCEYIN